MDEKRLQEIDERRAQVLRDGTAAGALRMAADDVPALVADVRRLTAALDAARREGAEGMRAAAVCLLDACGGPRSKLTIEDAIHAVNDAALDLDAPGGGS